MLIITRKKGKALVCLIGDRVVTVKIDRLDGSRVRFLVDAPKEVEIEKLRKVEAVKLPT